MWLAVIFGHTLKRLRSAAVFSASLMLALCVVGGLSPLTAQQDQEAFRAREMARRVPVTLAIVSSLPTGGEGIVILRRGASVPHDVIALTRGAATPERLSEAYFMLASVRGAMGDTASRDAMIKVPDSPPPDAWAKRTLSSAGRTLTRLTASQPQPVLGLGMVPAYVVYLKPGGLRSHMNKKR